MNLITQTHLGIQSFAYKYSVSCGLALKWALEEKQNTQNRL